MSAIARWCFSHRLAVIATWVVVLVGLSTLAQAIKSDYNTSFLEPGTDSATAKELLAKAVPAQAGDSDTIVWQVNHGTVRDAAVTARMTAVLRQVATMPEVAAVGLGEAEARARAGEVRVGKFPFRALGKAMATGHTDGFVKVVSGARHDEILGVHMIGAGVTDLIAEAGLACTLEATTEDLVATVHAHPTMAEALREAALVARGEGINV